ncbi:MAG: cysteine desulfurase [Clostridia bacterium]|nr:cysteine desulfurase [Clostridia bacterium]
MIYLDHAATTPVRDEVLAAMFPYFAQRFSNASSGYAAAREARSAIDRARSEVAAAIHAKSSEVYFTSGGSESDNWALLGAASANSQKKHIITTKIEHHAVLHTCRALEKRGYEITYLDVDDKGRISAEHLEQAIRSDTLLVSMMLANNEVGTIEPIAQMSQIAHAHGVRMHTDAVQAVGHIPVNVDELGVDMLSMSAHKLGGPKGCGALYVRSGVRIDNLIYGGAQERSMRAGTENVPAIVGMGKALALSVQNMAKEAAQISALRDELQVHLMELGGVRVNGDQESRLPGHLHVSIEGANTPLLLMQMDMAGIAVSAGSACSSGAAERSHVIKAMGLAGERQADIRFSIGADNTREEMTAVEQAMRRILKR